MDGVKAEGLTDTLVLRLGVIGTAVTERFAREVAGHGLKPKHAGLLALLASGGPASQLDLANVLHVAPSLMVSLVDHLEDVGAVRRVRDPGDRRRQIVSLAPEGERLLKVCADAARRLDEAVVGGLDAAQRRALTDLLGVVARDAGLEIVPQSPAR